MKIWQGNFEEERVSYRTDVRSQTFDVAQTITILNFLNDIKLACDTD